MRLSAGKLWSLRRLADPGGRFKMTAVDQRPPFFKLIREKRATDQVDYADVVALKVALARNLAPLSSAILLDPVWAYPNAIEDVRPSQGLILTLEDHAFDEDAGGRRSRAIGDWSVEKIKRLGADGVKLLIWYRPDADPAVCAHQEALVEEVGHACAIHDLCFVLELLVYPFTPTTGPDAVDDPAARPGLVLESLRRFTDPKFGVDLFKLESPVAADLVPDPETGTGAADCQAWFDRLGALTTRPWVMLSAGADMEAFRRILVYAYRAGASGYLCGRAIWWRAAQNFPDMAALERALGDEAVTYMREINALTDDLAAPWTDHDAFAGGALLADAGPDFVHAYGRA